ncbi:MAG: hypothetical protein MJZ86_02140, partial [Bacteroidales bacterium]|nr:hypothetical protein [Bacteroidales bacterium]
TQLFLKEIINKLIHPTGKKNLKLKKLCNFATYNLGDLRQSATNNNLIFKNISIMAEYGGLEELMLHAKSKYPGDLETQGKYASYFIKKMKEEEPDMFHTAKVDFNNNIVILTAFPNFGQFFYYWEMFTTRGALLGKGVEKSDMNMSSFELIFSSMSEVSSPIVPIIKQMGE